MACYGAVRSCRACLGGCLTQRLPRFGVSFWAQDPSTARLIQPQHIAVCRGRRDCASMQGRRCCEAVGRRPGTRNAWRACAAARRRAGASRITGAAGHVVHGAACAL